MFKRFLLFVILVANCSQFWAQEFSEGVFTYTILSNNDHEVSVKLNSSVSFIGTGTGGYNFVIPESVLYENKTYQVTSIDNDAFKSAQSNNFESFELPQTIRSIGDNAFARCKFIKSIIIPNSVISIGSHAFDGCSGLSTVELSNTLSTIGEYAFAGCTGLNSIELPNTLLELGEGVFRGCTYLKTISIPHGINSIPDKLFYNCSSLTSVTLPESVTSIRDYSFYGCEMLSSVFIPSNVIYIGEAAFHSCGKIETITLPNTLSFIGDYAFAYCKGLKLVLSEILVPYAIPTHAFSDTRCKLQVPHGTKNLYQNAQGWSKYFTSIEELIRFVLLSVKSIGNGVVSYDGTIIRDDFNSFSAEEGTNVVITISPDNDYQIKSVKINNTDVTSGVLNNTYTINNISSDTAVEVEFEAIPIPTYTLSVKASGNGSATYSGITAKNNTKSFTLNEGTSSTITFAPDNGYRIKSVKVNSVDVTSSVSNNSYTVSNIKANTTVEVEFEVIPVVINTYTLSVKSSGNGSATYSGTTAKNNTQSFTLNEGTSATITFAPDNGYRIKSVKVNSADVTSSVSNNSYTVSNIKANTTIEVEFEAIPIPTYTLSVKATGNGSATYSGTTAKNNTQSFTLNEGTSATITFTPDNGYRIKSVKVNSADVTSNVSNNSYTVSNIKANTTVEVEYEAIPIPTYTLSVKATGNGSATYSGTTAKNNTQTITLNEGTSATITFTPDNGYRIKSVKVNSTDVTSSVSNNSYTVSNIKANTTVEVEFEVIPINSYTLKYVVDGVTYRTYQIQEGATITPEAYPTKDGYTFSGWSEIPKTMPAKDVTIIGTFTKNEPVTMTYTLTITASGNGSATFNNTTAKNDSKTFTLNEGTSATIAFSPDNG